MNISKIALIISQIGLCVAMLPELIKVFRNTKKVGDLSLAYLLLRIFFFVLFALGLILKRDKDVLIIIISCFYYIIVYLIMLYIWIKYNIRHKQQHRSNPLARQQANPLARQQAQKVLK